MPNVTVDKSVNIIPNRTIKPSTLISMLLKKGLFTRLDMKYCKTDDNTTFNITDLNSTPLDFNERYSLMKDSCDLMNSLLKDTLGYHDRLNSFINNASYGQILFHKKGEIMEATVELDVNSLYATAMTTIRIPKGKPKEINIEPRNSGFNNYSAFILKLRLNY
jgi:hypothetical protein